MPLRDRGLPRSLPTLTEVVQANEGRRVEDANTLPLRDSRDLSRFRELERMRAAVSACVREAMDDWLQDQLASPDSALNLKLGEITRTALLGQEGGATAT